MKKNDYRTLGYCHDAELASMTFYTDDCGCRNLKITVRCHEDCGYSKWEGKLIEILFIEVFIANCRIIGYAIGNDSVDAISEGVRNNTQEDIKIGTDAGLKTPSILTTILFHSGSTVEVAFEDVKVSVLE